MMSVDLHDIVVVVLDGDCSSFIVHDVGPLLVVNVDVLDVADDLPNVFNVDVASSCRFTMFII